MFAQMAETRYRHGDLANPSLVSADPQLRARLRAKRSYVCSVTGIGIWMSVDVEPKAVPASDDETRFVDIYRRCSREIQAYCARRIPGSQVADAVADVFLVAWRRIDQVPEGDDTLPWLYGVAYRVLSHQWRYMARRRRLLERLRGLAEIQDFCPEWIVVGNEESRAVLEAARRLRAADQEILRLTLWEELSYEEVAQVLGLATTAVRERAYRARRNLAAEFEKLNSDRRRGPVVRRGGTGQ